MLQIDQFVCYFNILLRGKSLAIYFGDSQFRRFGIFNFIISKIYMLTNLYEYDEINCHMHCPLAIYIIWQQKMPEPKILHNILPFYNPS